MGTLGELKLKSLTKPKLIIAIDRAILDFGISAKCMVISGQPSYDIRSNIVKSVKTVDDILGIYPGPRRRYRSEGYYNVVVVK